MIDRALQGWAWWCILLGVSRAVIGWGPGGKFSCPLIWISTFLLTCATTLCTKTTVGKIPSDARPSALNLCTQASWAVSFLLLSTTLPKYFYCSVLNSYLSSRKCGVGCSSTERYKELTSTLTSTRQSCPSLVVTVYTQSRCNSFRLTRRPKYPQMIPFIYTTITCLDGQALRFGN